MALIDRAWQANVRLAIEPLHPMYADSRSAINTLRQANDTVRADRLAAGGRGGRRLSSLVGPADFRGRSSGAAATARCGRSTFATGARRPKDLLNDRGLMGEGCIDLREIRGWVEAGRLPRPDRSRDLFQSLLGHGPGRIPAKIKAAYLTRRATYPSAATASVVPKPNLTKIL